MAKKTLLERIESRLDKSTGCWVWTGCLVGGYGQIGVAGRQRARVHVAMWKLLRGPVPDGMCVLHNCPGGDNRACCNPDHLWIGTNGDNRRDAVKKLRTCRGSRNPQAKLTEAEVVEIAAEPDVNPTPMSKRYGVDPKTITFIRRGETWGWLTGIAPGGGTR